MVGKDWSKISKAYRDKNPGLASEQSKRYRAKCRLEAITIYSQGTMRCACCSENRMEFLVIDHINGRGKQASKLRGHGNLAQWLRARNFPLGYRVLCQNCNSSMGHYGYCPHQKETTNNE